MKALFGAISTAVGATVHAASAGFLCRVCGKPVQRYVEQPRCDKCIREGKR